jgi:hypothetical protein
MYTVVLGGCTGKGNMPWSGGAALPLRAHCTPALLRFWQRGQLQLLRELSWLPIWPSLGEESNPKLVGGLPGTRLHGACVQENRPADLGPPVV